MTTFLEHSTEPSLAAPQIERQPARSGQQLEKGWDVDVREEVVVAWGSRPRCPVLGLRLPGVAEAAQGRLLLRFGRGLDVDAQGLEGVGRPAGVVAVIAEEMLDRLGDLGLQLGPALGLE